MDEQIRSMGHAWGGCQGLSACCIGRGRVFGRFDLAALCGCHTLNVCCVMLCYVTRPYMMVPEEDVR